MVHRHNATLSIMALCIHGIHFHLTDHHPLSLIGNMLRLPELHRRNFAEHLTNNRVILASISLNRFQWDDSHVSMKRFSIVLDNCFNVSMPPDVTAPVENKAF